MFGDILKGIVKETILIPKNIIEGVAEGLEETFDDTKN